MDEVRQGNLQRAGLEGVDETARAAVKLQLREITEQVASEMLGADPSPYLDSLLRQLTAGLDPKDPDNGSFTGPLAAFVDEEALPFLGVDPVRTEWSFEPFNPAAVAAELDGVPITSSGALDVVVSGTVDRVDEAPAGEAGLAGTRRAVYDYKAGRVSTLSSIERGLNMQPVIYAAAAGNPEEITATVTGYRELPADGSSGRTRLAGDPSALAALSSQGRVGRGFSTTSLPIDRALWAVLLRRAEWYGQLIGAGVFPTTLAGTKEAGCKHCDFRRVCRHDTLRTALTGQETDTVGSFLPRPHNARKALTVLLQAEDDATVERDAP